MYVKHTQCVICICKQTNSPCLCYAGQFSELTFIHKQLSYVSPMPSGDLYWLLLALHSVLSDETCFVPSERIYDCGPASNEAECESRGCCYNASAMVACYYPSGTVIGSILHVCRY